MKYATTLNTNFDRVVATSDLEIVARALAYAETEIHNPGAARSGNYDVLDLIDQAKAITKKVMTENAIVNP